MSTLNSELSKKCINTIRLLSADAVQKANSGHPGMPMGCAPIAYILYSKLMNHNPKNPDWYNRDRFVLSAGHGSMLLYSILHLTGYKISLDDIKNFRQLGSITPGHPEYGITPGVETTTGPLGQGLANAVGMATAYSYLASYFNKEDNRILDHFIYVLASDGELMEGISHEACAFAGHNKFSNLIVFYDDNKISIDGSTDLAMSEDVATRFEGYGWHVQIVDDVNDMDILETAVLQAKKEDKPSIIITRTNIGYGSPNKQDTSASHGAPLGVEELKLTKKNLGFDENESFVIDEDVQEYFNKAINDITITYEKWIEQFNNYKEKYPEEAILLEKLFNDELDINFIDTLPLFNSQNGNLATRAASGKVINMIAEKFPFIIGGSADLSESNNTTIHKEGDFGKENYLGRNIHFGVREQGMASIMNGITLYANGLIPFGGTFLVFIDYMRSPMRMAALMGIKPIFVLTHDSIGLGEDGPTHQPVEHLASLRAVPNLVLFRPADANETLEAWKFAIKHKNGPVALALSRQKIELIDREKYNSAEGVHKGGYILRDTQATPDAIIISTGSEITLALSAAEKLAEKNINIRVVSLPSWEVFEKQSKDYKESVLPKNVTRRLVIEAGIKMGWEKYIGFEGDIISIETFGESAPAEILFEKFGFTIENVIKKIEAMI